MTWLLVIHRNTFASQACGALVSDTKVHDSLNPISSLPPSLSLSLSVVISAMSYIYLDSLSPHDVRTSPCHCEAILVLCTWLLLRSLIKDSMSDCTAFPGWKFFERCARGSLPLAACLPHRYGVEDADVSCKTMRRSANSGEKGRSHCTAVTV